MPSCRRICLTVLMVLTTIVSMRWVLGPIWHGGFDWTTWGGQRFNFVILANARTGLAWGGILMLATVALHRSSRASQLFVRAAVWAAMLASLSDVIGRIALEGRDLAWISSGMGPEQIVSQGILLVLPGSVLLLMGRQGLDSDDPSSVRFSGSLALASVLVGAVGMLGLANSVGLKISAVGVLLGLLLIVTAHGLARMRVWALASYVLLTTLVLGLAIVSLASSVQGLSMPYPSGSLHAGQLLMAAVLVLQLLVVVPVILAITRGHPVPESPRRERIGFLVAQTVVALLMAGGVVLLAVDWGSRLPG